MTRILQCNACFQQFEVPAEHVAAPALQCPFCATIVANTEENLASPEPAAAAPAEPEPSAPVEDDADFVEAEEEDESPTLAHNADALRAAAAGTGGMENSVLSSAERRNPFTFASAGAAAPRSEPEPDQDVTAIGPPPEPEPAAAAPEPAPAPPAPAPPAPKLPAPKPPARPQRQHEPEAPALTGEAPLQEQSAVAGGDDNIIEQMARRLSGDQPGGVIVDGLPSQQAAPGAPMPPLAVPQPEVFTPDVDPHMPGYGAAAAPGYPNPGLPQPGALPLPTAPPTAPATPVETDTYDEEESYTTTDFDDDYGPAPGPYDDIVNELPEGTKLPGRGRIWALYAFVALMFAGFILMFLAASANNGIFHFERFGQSFGPLFSGAEPMELAQRKAPVDDEDDFEPVRTTVDEKPNLRIALSPPRGISMGEGGPVVVLVHGLVTNIGPQRFKTVDLEGVIRSAGTGGELVTSTAGGLVSPDVLSGGPAALLEQLQAMPTMAEVQTWITDLDQKSAALELPQQTPTPFVIAFVQTTALDPNADLLFEVRAVNAEPAL